METAKMLLMSVILILFSQKGLTDARPCGTCLCYFRTGYVACNREKADEIYDTLCREDLGWAQTLDLRNMAGVLDTRFYTDARFPILHEVDLCGKYCFHLYRA